MNEDTTAAIARPRGAPSAAANATPPLTPLPDDDENNEFEDPVSARPRRVWTTAEDEALRRAISEVGEEDFRRVAARVPNRSSKQCRERWFNNLAPQIKKNKLSKREWAIVLQAQKELGNRWSEIAKRLPGRTAAQIKNYWHSTLRANVSKYSLPAPEEQLHGGAQVPAQFLPPYALPYPLPDADGSWAARTQKYIIRPNGQKENGKDQEVEGENESGGKDDDSDKEKRSSPSAGSEYSDKRGRKEKRTSDEEDDDEEVGPPHKRLKMDPQMKSKPRRRSSTFSSSISMSYPRTSGGSEQDLATQPINLPLPGLASLGQYPAYAMPQSFEAAAVMVPQMAGQESVYMVPSLHYPAYQPAAYIPSGPSMPMMVNMAQQGDAALAAAQPYPPFIPHYVNMQQPSSLHRTSLSAEAQIGVSFPGQSPSVFQSLAPIQIDNNAKYMIPYSHSPTVDLSSPRFNIAAPTYSPYQTPPLRSPTTGATPSQPPSLFQKPSHQSWMNQ